MPERSDRPYNVEISGGKGAVVGDYATVFQTFSQSAPSLASYIRALQFRALVNERTTGFLGRDSVFERIDELINGEEFDSGYIVVRGEPGIGKTSIAAMLVLRHGCVHHFNIALENICTARKFLENVCAQIITRYHLDHSTLPASAGEDSGFLSQLLAEAVERSAAEGQGPVLIVVDALDEVDDSAHPVGANRLFLPRTLPKGVFFLLTTREEIDYRLDVDHEADIWLLEDDPNNLRDLADYISAFLAKHAEVMGTRLTEWGVTSEKFSGELVRLSEGNFMYLAHVLPDIAGGAFRLDTRDGMNGLPRGLIGYYQRHWRSMKDLDALRFSNLQRPILCFLAISREPVTIAQLAEWTRLESGEVRAVISEWRAFLNEDTEVQPARYRIYHRSFSDFLDRREDLRTYHERVTINALAKIPGFPSSLIST